MIGRGARERGLVAFDGNRIGAGDDDEIGIGERVAHGVELLHHLGGRNDALVVVVAALLGEGLVLEVERGDADALEGAGGALRGQRVAVAGVGIGDHRHAHRLDHLGKPLDDLVGRDQAHVGHAGAARDGAAARIDRGEARLLDEARGEAVIGAGRDHDAVLAQHVLQSGGGAHAWASLVLGD